MIENQDLLRYVASFLSMVDRVRASGVCVQWRQLFGCEITTLVWGKTSTGCRRRGSGLVARQGRFLATLVAHVHPNSVTPFRYIIQERVGVSHLLSLTVVFDARLSTQLHSCIKTLRHTRRDPVFPQLRSLAIEIASFDHANALKMTCAMVENAPRLKCFSMHDPLDLAENEIVALASVLGRRELGKLCISVDEDRLDPILLSLPVLTQIHLVTEGIRTLESVCSYLDESRPCLEFLQVDLLFEDGAEDEGDTTEVVSRVLTQLGSHAPNLRGLHLNGLPLSASVVELNRVGRRLSKLQCMSLEATRLTPFDATWITESGAFAQLKSLCLDDIELARACMSTLRRQRLSLADLTVLSPLGTVFNF